VSDYLLQEDGVGKFTLEDGTGFILLESGAPPVVVAPGGSHIIAVAPRRRLLDKRNRRGRLKWPLARIDVYAPTPGLHVSFDSPRSNLTMRAGAIRATLSFMLQPARAVALYTKRRDVDRELEIRKAIIADLTDRDANR
jgi:hypothetical protein